MTTTAADADMEFDNSRVVKFSIRFTDKYRRRRVKIRDCTGEDWDMTWDDFMGNYYCFNFGPRQVVKSTSSRNRATYTPDDLVKEFIMPFSRSLSHCVVQIVTPNKVNNSSAGAKNVKGASNKGHIQSQGQSRPRPVIITTTSCLSASTTKNKASKRPQPAGATNNASTKSTVSKRLPAAVAKQVSQSNKQCYIKRASQGDLPGNSGTQSTTLAKPMAFVPIEKYDDEDIEDYPSEQGHLEHVGLFADDSSNYSQSNLANVNGNVENSEMEEETPFVYDSITGFFSNYLEKPNQALDPRVIDGENVEDPSSQIEKTEVFIGGDIDISDYSENIVDNQGQVPNNNENVENPDLLFEKTEFFIGDVTSGYSENIEDNSNMDLGPNKDANIDETLENLTSHLKDQTEFILDDTTISVVPTFVEGTGRGLPDIKTEILERWSKCSNNDFHRMLKEFKDYDAQRKLRWMKRNPMTHCFLNMVYDGIESTWKE